MLPFCDIKFNVDIDFNVAGGRRKDCLWTIISTINAACLMLSRQQLVSLGQQWLESNDLHVAQFIPLIHSASLNVEYASLFAESSC